MALLETPGMENGFQAVDFELKNIDGNTLSLKDCQGKNGTVIMFICNHCPYVKAVIDRVVETAKELKQHGIKCVAIMPNDTENYPADSFKNMQKFAKENGFTFPYLIDETQEIAKAYDAVCTPDFFGFDKNGLLQYRGRLDSAANKPADAETVPELKNAMLAVKDKGESDERQYPSMGCSIKWKQ